MASFTCQARKAPKRKRSTGGNDPVALRDVDTPHGVESHRPGGALARFPPRLLAQGLMCKILFVKFPPRSERFREICGCSRCVKHLLVLIRWSSERGGRYLLHTYCVVSFNVTMTVRMLSSLRSRRVPIPHISIPIPTCGEAKKKEYGAPVTSAEGPWSWGLDWNLERLVSSPRVFP